MKKFYLLSFLGVVLLGGITGIPANGQIGSQRLASTAFVSTKGTVSGVNSSLATAAIAGWVASGSGSVLLYNTRTYVSDDSRQQVFTQGITNANLKGQGADITLVIQPMNSVSSSTLATFQVSYGGILYGAITTTNGPGTTAAITYSNGASGALNSMVMTRSGNGTSWTVHLPANIGNSGDLQLTFMPTGGSCDDFNIYSVNFMASPVHYTGTVFDDGNGMTDGLINGPEVAPDGLQMGLFDVNDRLIQGTTVSVQADGTFDIAIDSTGDFRVGFVTSPAYYVSTGEKLPAESGSDGTADGKTSQLTIINSTANSDISGIRFGVNRLPTTDNVSQTLGASDVSGNSVPAGKITSSATGSDPEDGAIINGTVVIKTLPDDAILMYDGIAVTAGQIIPGFDPSRLSLSDIQPSATSTSFGYSIRDANGDQSAEPGVFAVSFPPVVLPVSLTDFKIKQNANCDVVISWTAALESNVVKYTVRQSTNGGSGFTDAFTTAAQNVNGSHYSCTIKQTTPVAYYRVDAIEAGGKIISSQLKPVRSACGMGGHLHIYPNPVANMSSSTIRYSDSYKGSASLQVINSAGKVVISKIVTLNGESNSFHLDKNIAPGIYFLQLTLAEGTVIRSAGFIKK